MIINEVKPTLEASAKMEKIMFSVGNAGLLFEILRSKMYGNPIQSICRELISNAIDSHRERYGNDDKQIQITLPNAIEPAFKVKDWGVGISPDRVQNVYTAWGNSTKRDDNTQIGGFGLGSRTPWAISDSFTCDTVVDGIRYVYACVIDETKIGACIKMSENPTDETNGTEIIVPVKPSDFGAFVSGVEFCTRHLKTKPTIKGGKIQWQTQTPILEGTDWQITPAQGYSRQPRLVIDSIEYPLDLAQLPDGLSLRIFYDVQGDVILSFATGQISLSASRESVHLDKPTIEKIVARAKAAYEELQARFQAKIDSSSTLKDAYINYTSLQQTITSLPKMEYKGVELSNTVYIPHMEEYSKTGGPIHASYLRFDSYNRDCPIYINDLSKTALTRKQIAKLFAREGENPNRVLIVNSSSSDDDWETKLEEKVAELHLEELGATYLSEEISLDPEKPVMPRMTVFKFEHGKFSRTKYLSFKEDKNKKVLCTLHRNAWSKTARYPQYKGSQMTVNQMTHAFNDPAISIYGLDESIKPSKIKRFFKGCETLDEYITEKFSVDFDQIVKAKAMQRLSSNVKNGKWGNFLVAVCGKEDQLHLNDEIKKIIATYQKQEASHSEDYTSVLAYEAVIGYIDDGKIEKWIRDHKDETIDCTKALDKVFKQYPLLVVMDWYGWNERIKDIAEYMQLIDNRNAKENGK